MKGFEVTFRGKTVRIAVNEPIVFCVLVKKIHGQLDMSVNASLLNTHIHTQLSWMWADDLKEGDEIFIERKEVEESSPTLFPPAYFDPNNPPAPPTPTPEQHHEMWQYRLKRFRDIESLLHKEGLI